MPYIIESRKNDMPPYEIEHIIHHKNKECDEDYWTANIKASFTDNNGVKHDNLATSPSVYTNISKDDIDWNTLKAILVELGLPAITKQKLKCEFYTRNNGVSTYYSIKE